MGTLIDPPLKGLVLRAIELAQKAPDNVQMMKKKIVAETVIKSQQMKCTRKMVIER